MLLCSLTCFSFNWDNISNTGDGVSSAVQTPQSLSKILCWMSYFQLFSTLVSVFGQPDETRSLTFDIIHWIWQSKLQDLSGSIAHSWHEHCKLCLAIWYLISWYAHVKHIISLLPTGHASCFETLNCWHNALSFNN